MPWVMSSMHKVNGRKTVKVTAEGRLSLAGNHLLGIVPHRLSTQQTLNRAQGKEQSLPPGLHQLEEEEDCPATPTPRAKEGHARRTPRDTTKAGQEHCCLFIYIRKTKLSSTEQYI